MNEWCDKWVNKQCNEWLNHCGMNQSVCNCVCNVLYCVLIYVFVFQGHKTIVCENKPLETYGCVSLPTRACSILLCVFNFFFNLDQPTIPQHFTSWYAMVVWWLSWQRTTYPWNMWFVWYRNPPWNMQIITRSLVSYGWLSPRNEQEPCAQQQLWRVHNKDGVRKYCLPR